MSRFEGDEAISDDEVFIGKLTLKELKKHILWDKHRDRCIVSAVCSPNKTDNLNASLKIIQTHSQPNLRLNSFDSNSSDFSSQRNNTSWSFHEDSFIKMEDMVANHNTQKTEELNNTLEVIEYILNNPPNSQIANSDNALNKEECSEDNVNNVLRSEINTDLLSSDTINKREPINEDVMTKKEPAVETHYTTLSKTNYNEKEAELLSLQTFDNKELKSEDVVTLQELAKEVYSLALTSKNGTEKLPVLDTLQCPQTTPVKTNNVVKPYKGYFTPRSTPSKIIPKTPIFKTPGPPLSVKKPSASTSLKKTPSKSNAYQHVSSPVATYIKNCPIVPLVKEIHPKKPLPGPSSIPKLKNPAPIKTSNKENVNLPAIAYKSAKKTKVIDIPDEKKLPQNEWAKKLTSLPRPIVIKHDHRELNFSKKKLLQQNEDSFDNLSFHQAEVSVCMQKTAFKTNKNLSKATPYSPNFPPRQGYAPPPDEKAESYPMNPQLGYPGPPSGPLGPPARAGPPLQPGVQPLPRMHTGYPQSLVVYTQPGPQEPPDGFMTAQQSSGCPPGLECLSSMDQVLVHQRLELIEILTGYETKNKYDIKNIDGRIVYYAVEIDDALIRDCTGNIRPFLLKIIDDSRREVIHVYRPLACNSCWFPCCMQSLEVCSPPGTFVGTIKQRWSPLKTYLDIMNADGDLVFKIRGPIFNCGFFTGVDYYVYCKDGLTKVGKITRQWPGLAMEIFTDRDYFGISFPMDANVQIKAILIGACFLIDFMFFED